LAGSRAIQPARPRRASRSSGIASLSTQTAASPLPRGSRITIFDATRHLVLMPDFAGTNHDAGTSDTYTTHHRYLYLAVTPQRTTFTWSTWEVTECARDVRITSWVAGQFPCLRRRYSAATAHSKRPISRQPRLPAMTAIESANSITWNVGAEPSLVRPDDHPMRPWPRGRLTTFPDLRDR
jgi:hypothetical protein